MNKKINFKIFFKKLVFCIALYYLFHYSAFADIKVIGNIDIPHSTLTKEEVKNIFTGKKKLWGNNKKISIAILIKSNTQEEFHNTFLKINLEQFVHLWRLMIYKGQAKFPKIFDTEDELIDYIAKHSNSIGYISKNIDNSSIKEFIIIQ